MQQKYIQLRMKKKENIFTTEKMSDFVSAKKIHLIYKQGKKLK